MKKDNFDYWQFIQDNLPDYYKNNAVALSNDINAVLDGEASDSSEQHVRHYVSNLGNREELINLQVDVDTSLFKKALRHYLKRNDTKSPESSNEESIWMRAGITIKGSKQEIEEILGGNDETLQRLIKTGSYEFDGESYIPSTVIERYNKEHDTNFDEYDMDFNL